MTFRSLLALAVLLPTTTMRAADCVSVTKQNDEYGRPSAYASVIGNACGPLKIVDKRRDDPVLI